MFDKYIFSNKIWVNKRMNELKELSGVIKIQCLQLLFDYVWEKELKFIS